MKILHKIIACKTEAKELQLSSDDKKRRKVVLPFFIYLLYLQVMQLKLQQIKSDKRRRVFIFQGLQYKTAGD
jgi:hypothetical protein